MISLKGVPMSQTSLRGPPSWGQGRHCARGRYVGGPSLTCRTSTVPTRATASCGDGDRLFETCDIDEHVATELFAVFLQTDRRSRAVCRRAARTLVAVGGGAAGRQPDTARSP